MTLSSNESITRMSSFGLPTKWAFVFPGTLMDSSPPELFSENPSRRKGIWLAVGIAKHCAAWRAIMSQRSHPARIFLTGSGKLRCLQTIKDSVQLRPKAHCELLEGDDSDAVANVAGCSACVPTFRSKSKSFRPLPVET